MSSTAEEPTSKENHWERTLATAKLLMPGSLVVGLLFYFGWVRTDTLHRQFGITPDVLHFTTADTVLRSADVIYRLALRVIIVVAVAFTVHRVLTRWFLSPRHMRCKRWLARLSLAIGLSGAFSFGFVVLTEKPYFCVSLFPALLLSVGSLIVVAFSLSTVQKVDPVVSSRLDSLGCFGLPARWLLFGLFAVLLFGATDLYAKRVGIERADWLAEQSDRLPFVTIYSRTHLGFNEGAVRCEELNIKEGYAYRYTGLRLLISSKGYYCLFPEQRSPRDGVLVIREGQEVRFEFSPSVPAQ